MFNFKKLSLFLLAALIAVQFIPGSRANVFADTGSNFVYGDVNGDGSVDSLDLIILQKYVLGNIDKFPSENGVKAADLDVNGVVDSIDYELFKQYLTGKIKDFPVNNSPATSLIAQSTPIPLELKDNNIVSYKSFNVSLGNSIGSVPREESLSYNWRVISQPSESNALIDNPSIKNPNFTADTAGDYVLGVTVSNGRVTSDEKTLNVKIKEFGATTDDIDENAFTKNYLTGYDFSDYIPLSDGWIIVKSKASNKVIFLNVFTGTHGKEFVVDGTPDRMEFDFEREILLVSLKDNNSIAKINMKTEKITYIDIGNNIVDITLGEKGIVFVLGVNGTGRVIYVVDIIKGKIKNSISVKEKYGIMVYDKEENNLIAGELGYSPSTLGRYSFDENTFSLETQQISNDVGSNGQDLAISVDGKHVAFSCGGGNGKGYTIFDIDSSDINKKFGEWDIGAYPRSADFSLDSKYLVASNGFEVKIFDVENHKAIGVVSKASGSKCNVSFSRGGKIVYDAGTDILYINQSGIIQAEVEPPQVLQSPTARTTGDRIALKGIEVNLDGSASDKGSGTYIEYEWAIVSKPGNSQVVIENENMVKANFAPDMAGQYCISLTVSNEAGESEPAFVNITVQNISDTVDIIESIEEGYLEGYLPIKPIALPSGWIIAADTRNVVKIINVMTKEVIAQYQVSAIPNKLSYDFENDRIVVSLKSDKRIAVIDINEDSVYYIDTPYSYNGIVYGEENIAFAISDDWPKGYISIIDIQEKKVLNSIEVSVYKSGLIEYDPIYNNLFFADSGTSPSSLYRYSFNEVTKELKIEQKINNAGGNARDMNISNDGKHLVLCCGSGNGDGYTIFDFDATNLERKFDEFDTGAYPNSGAFSNDGNYFIASNGSKLLLFDANNHSLINTIKSGSYAAAYDKVLFSRGDNIIYNIVESRIYYYKNPIY
ncbi:dockerin type I domain-containing protein [Acetivibrio clariflavus]|uniref:PKD domain-containing protein n=1 Tax=Acetivibrio clariflavus TaxID=288965 RepID=UPI0031F4D5C4